jgi:hypothetical protein
MLPAPPVEVLFPKGGNEVQLKWKAVHICGGKVQLMKYFSKIVPNWGAGEMDLSNRILDLDPCLDLDL